jgi:hypothetical protein
MLLHGRNFNFQHGIANLVKPISHAKFIHSFVGKTEHIWKNFEDETKESFYWERLKKLSRKEEDLDSHMVDHKKEMLECENCRTKFRWKKNLRKHKNEACNSDGSWIHLCQICESQFCTGKLLKAHDISTHREFACSFCGKVFALKQNFDFHSKKRSPFLCTHCGRMFCNKQAFGRHMSHIHFKFLEEYW